MGVAMSSATLPAKGGTIFDMEDGDMEIGMGIHGEPGIRRGKIDTADNVIDEIMEPILKDLPYVEGDEVYVLVNSLGATPLIDLHVCYRRVAQILESLQSISRTICLFYGYGWYVCNINETG